MKHKRAIAAVIATAVAGLAGAPSVASAAEATSAKASAKPNAARYTRYVPQNIASNCSVDVTEKLNKWIRSVPDNSALALESKGCYRIDGTIKIEDRNRLWIDGRNSTFKAGTPGGTQRAQWRVTGGYKIFLSNMYVQGANPTPGRYSTSRQHQHSLDLRGVTTFTAENIRMSKPGGDCVYITRRWDGAKNWSKDVNVRDSSCDGPGRHGIAAVAVDGAVINYTKFSRIGRTVLDIEPDGSTYGTRNVKFANNVATGPFPGHFISLIGAAPVEDINIARNRVYGSGVYIGVIPRNGQRHKRIRIVGNSSDTGRNAPGSAAIEVRDTDGLEVADNKIKLGGPNMSLLKTSNTCGIKVLGNSLLGAVVEARLVGKAC